jgi:hypothetical protein
MMSKTEVTRYELPPAGISLLGYIVRRMHKTQWLAPIAALLEHNKTEEALARVALYAAAASTSFGKAYYQPRSNVAGEEISEPDPATGAAVRARLDANSPTYKISYSVTLPDGSSFEGQEEITGTTVGLRGLGMPAPSRFNFRSGGYSASLAGILTSELALSLTGNTRIRAHGFLTFQDSAGNTGRLDLARSGEIALQINDLPAMHHSLLDSAGAVDVTIPRQAT